MNWLAHLLLSEPDPAFRVGNILPDLLSAGELTRFPADFQKGILLHHRIDAFTDRHPVVRRSVERIQVPYRRFGGVLVDMFYDHILAREWDHYSSIPLEEFAQGIYLSFREVREMMPLGIQLRFDQMSAGNLLCTYRDLSGIAEALDRIDSRLSRPCNLSGSIVLLETHYESLKLDFQQFFPQLAEHSGMPIRKQFVK